MRNSRFIVLTSLLAVTLLAWLLSYPFGTVLIWSRVTWKDNTVRVQFRSFEYSDGKLFVALGGFGSRITANRDQVDHRLRAQFPPFRRLKPWPHSWGPNAWELGGLGISHADNGISNVWEFGFPFWLPASLFLIIPLRVAFRRWLAMDRRRHGLCPGCGYDLRATAGACPECGSVPHSQVLAAECGPAIVATARSTGTIAVVILSAYLTVATILVVQSLIHWQAPLLPRGLAIAGAMVLVLIGSFHAAGYSRSGEALFGFGALAGLLLLPVYIRLGDYTSPAIQAMASLACLIVMGLLARACGALRWRLQASERQNSDGRLRPV